MPLVKAQCTNCGANLEVDSGKDAAICPMCNTPYIVEKAIQNFYNYTAGKDSLDSLLAAGEKFLDSRMWDEADRYFKEAEKSYPSDYRVHWDQFLCFTRNMRPDEIIENVEIKDNYEYVPYDPYMSGSYNDYQAMTHDPHCIQRAIDDRKKIVSLAKNYYNRAMVLAPKDKKEELKNLGEAFFEKCNQKIQNFEERIQIAIQKYDIKERKYQAEQERKSKEYQSEKEHNEKIRGKKLASLKFRKETLPLTLYLLIMGICVIVTIVLCVSGLMFPQGVALGFISYLFIIYFHQFKDSRYYALRDATRKFDDRWYKKIQRMNKKRNKKRN